MRRVVELRLDPRMRPRLDPSDVVQEAQLEVARRIDYYLALEGVPFLLWLRQAAYENLLRLRRQHVEAGCRTVMREVPVPSESSALFVCQLLGRGPGPSDALLQEELAQRLREALGRLEESDREIVLLRNFEGLGIVEAAQVLGLTPNTASKRYGRALLRLRKLLKRDESTDQHA
jgi:RNA polymerase sigma-70 factor (ECF subfamily)